MGSGQEPSPKITDRSLCEASERQKAQTSGEMPKRPVAEVMPPFTVDQKCHADADDDGLDFDLDEHGQLMLPQLPALPADLLRPIDAPPALPARNVRWGPSIPLSLLTVDAIIGPLDVSRLERQADQADKAPSTHLPSSSPVLRTVDEIIGSSLTGSLDRELFDSKMVAERQLPPRNSSLKRQLQHGCSSPAKIQAYSAATACDPL